MENRLKLEIASPDDLPVIVDIYNQTISSRMVTADTEPISVESRLIWFAAHNEETRPLWIVKVEDKIVGWMSFQSFYGRPAYQHTVELSIYLDRDWHGLGIGQEVLQRAIDLAPQYGVRTLLGFIFGHNEPSLNLFRKYGFEDWARLPEVAEMDDILYDLLILGRKV